MAKAEVTLDLFAGALTAREDVAMNDGICSNCRRAAPAVYSDGQGTPAWERGLLACPRLPERKHIT